MTPDELQQILDSMAEGEDVLMSPLLNDKIEMINRVVRGLEQKIPRPKFSLMLYLLGKSLEDIELEGDYDKIKAIMFDMITLTFERHFKKGD